ncbi:nuclear factor 7, ovary-like isoform X2 [Engystomops pustulosus]|uniref:nuclear factor 7, ovary-like isoform X2 n=1 Tax=Engystomops pustulosus TaxID=76066 RepID=UPI003AFA7A5A
MDAATRDHHPIVPQQDHETKSDGLAKPTRVKVEKSKPQVSKLTKSNLRYELMQMQMVLSLKVAEIYNNITTIQENLELNQSSLGKSFCDFHRLLETDEEIRMENSKKQEDQVIQKVEVQTLQLVHLMEKIQRAKTKDQLNALEKNLKKLERPEEELDIGEPPVQRRISKQMMNIVKPVPEEIRFDPESAHPNLALSPDFKQVRFENTPKMLKTSSQCFEPGLYVLGTPGFKSGRHYWEVNVGYKSNWIIGVVKESVERKGIWELNQTNGYWVLRKQWDHLYYAIGNTCEMITYNYFPLRIGVCLDLFKNHVIFYDADTTKIIHQLSFPCVKEMMCPFFCPGFLVREDDWCPLAICT